MSSKNVSVTFKDEKGFQIFENPSPIDIKPSNGIEIIMIVFESTNNKLNLEFEWNDDFKDNNKDFQTIQV